MKDIIEWKKRKIEEEARLQEMAFSKQKIELAIISTNTSRIKHLMLVYFLSKNQAVKHWQGEIQASLIEIQRMRWKGNNKWLPAREYFNNLWRDPFENGDRYIGMSVYIDDLIEEGYELKDVDWKKEKDNFVKDVQTFYNEVSENLSRNRLTKSIVYGLIDKYIINGRRTIK